MMAPTATASASPMYVEERVYRTPSDEGAAKGQNGHEQSAFVMESTAFAERIAWVLPSPTAGVLLRVEVGEESASTPIEEGEADRVNRDRLVFLSRKYADQRFGPEAAARLEILTERIRRLIPRVTPHNMEVMENVANNLAASQEANRALEEELDEIERGG